MGEFCQYDEEVVMKKLLCALLCVCMLTAFAQETAATEQLRILSRERCR